MNTTIRFRIPLIVTIVVLIAGTTTHVVDALPSLRSDEARIGRTLITEPNSWPWTLAKLFADSLPVRIKHPLSGQTAKTIRAFVLKMETPYVSGNDDRLWLCAASCGAGGSAVSLIAEKESQYRYVWDTLITPSLISSRLWVADLNDDSVPETIYSGQMLNSSEREWAILQWDNGRMRLMAPRLDMPSSYLLDNRLIGDSLRVLEVRDHGVQRLGLWRDVERKDAGSETAKRMTHYREFFYIDSIGGYMPTEGYKH